MKLRLVALLVLVFATGNALGEESSAVTQFAKAVMNTFADIIASGGAIWTKLGEGQAVAVLQELASKAATLEGQKDALRKKLVNATPNAKVDLHPEVLALAESVRDIARTLERFSVEVDKAAHPLGEDLRVELDKAQTDKILELDRVEESWVGGRNKEAILHLDAAVKELQTMRKAVACLQDSIAKKKAACDPKSLEHKK